MSDCTRPEANSSPNNLREVTDLHEKTLNEEVSQNAQSDILSAEVDYSHKSRLLFDQMKTGVARVDLSHQIQACNRSFKSIVEKVRMDQELPECSPIGADFYGVLGNLDLKGPDYCPFANVKRFGTSTETTIGLSCGIYEMDVSPLISPHTREVTSFLVEIKDSTKYIELEETIDRLQNAGQEMNSLSGEEIKKMSTGERLDLLKSQIVTLFTEIFPYDVFVFRLLDRRTNCLDLLVSQGLSPEAEIRVLHAESSNNGISGYVSKFNEPYLCEDVLGDPHYLLGNEKTQSSLTVPLTFQGEIFGTCNVESFRSCTFSKREIYFIQLFANEVAKAIHTLELLSQENQKGVWESVVNIQKAVWKTLDELLRESSGQLDAVFLQITELESQLTYLKELQQASPKSMESALQSLINSSLQSRSFLQKNAESLRLILESSRGIKDTIILQRTMLNKKQEGLDPDIEKHPLLKRRRVLVVDRNPDVLANAHELLERYECVVETAPDTLSALQMIKNYHYDLILCELRPAGGMSLLQFMLRLYDFFPGKERVPLIASVEGDGIVGKDHALADAMARGLLGRIQHIPIILHQLISQFERVINCCGERDEKGVLIPPPENIALQEESLIESPGHPGHIFSLTGGKTGSVASVKDVCEATHGVPGFYLQGESKRLDQWADKFRQDMKASKAEDGENSVDSGEPVFELDAT